MISINKSIISKNKPLSNINDLLVTETDGKLRNSATDIPSITKAMKVKDRMKDLLEDKSQNTVVADSKNGRFYKTEQNLAKHKKNARINTSNTEH